MAASYKSIKRFAQRKRHSKQYKSAIEQYSEKLHQILLKETKLQLNKMSDNPVDILISSPLPDNKLKGFTLANLPEVRVNESVSLIRKAASDEVVARGSVISAGPDGVRVRLSEPLEVKKEALNDDKVFRLKFDGKHIITRRQRVEQALRRFRDVSCSLTIHRGLLGHFNDICNTRHQRARVFCPDSSINLDKAQRLAVEYSMKKKISLIEGVAGSGKSLVAASIAYSMKRFRNSKVLLCSPMQATVDKLAKMLAKNAGHVKVVKLDSEQQRKSHHYLGQDGGDYGEEVFVDEDGLSPTLSTLEDPTAENYALDTIVNEALFMRRYQRSIQPVAGKGRRMYYQGRAHASAKKHARRFVSIASPWLRRKEERRVLEKADIICCTLVQAGSPQLSGLKFDMLVVDDAHAAQESDCLVAMMVKGLKQVTFVSELRREIRLARASSKNSKLDTDMDEVAKPSITSKALAPSKAKRDSINQEPYIRLRRMSSASGKRPNGIHRSKPLVAKQKQRKNSYLGPGGLFERLLAMGLSAVVLKYQFRMHETLAALPNYHFYLSKLKTNQAISQGLNREIMNDLVLDDDSFEWLPNPKCLTALFVCTKDSTLSVEDATQEIIDNLVSRENVRKSRIGILTNNRAHTTIPHAKFDGICIGTVEDYFGLERDFMVLSCKDFKSIDNEVIDEEKPNNADAIQCNFLKSDTALLTALTRARLGLFIVADESICQVKDKIDKIEDSDSADSCHKSEQGEKKSSEGSKFCQSWKALVRYYEENNIMNIKQSKA